MSATTGIAGGGLVLSVLNTGWLIWTDIRSRRVAWTTEYQAENVWLLINVGGRTARQVAIDREKITNRNRVDPTSRTPVAPQQSLRIRRTTQAGAPPVHEVHVTWGRGRHSVVPLSTADHA